MYRVNNLEYLERSKQFRSDLERLNLALDITKNEYDADEVWAASWAAFRLNGYQYIREYQGNFEDGKIINRARIYRILTNKEVLTDEDREMGQEMLTFNTRLTMMALTRELNSFEQLIAEIVLKNKVTGKDIGIIASLASNFDRELQRRKKAAEINKLAEGKHLGEIDARMALENVEVVHSSMSQKYLRYYNMGNYNGNLVAWWSDTGFTLFTRVNMTARIKEHCVWNGENGTVPMTKLTYVRMG